MSGSASHYGQFQLLYRPEDSIYWATLIQKSPVSGGREEDWKKVTGDYYENLNGDLIPLDLKYRWESRYTIFAPTDDEIESLTNAQATKQILRLVPWVEGSTSPTIEVYLVGLEWDSELEGHHTGIQRRTFIVELKGVHLVDSPDWTGPQWAFPVNQSNTDSPAQGRVG